jgi:hypothetical protein
MTDLEESLVRYIISTNKETEAMVTNIFKAISADSIGQSIDQKQLDEFINIMISHNHNMNSDEFVELCNDHNVDGIIEFIKEREL